MSELIRKYLSNITEQCENRLHELYECGIPSLVMNRYQKELSLLKVSSYIVDFEIFRTLANHAQKCNFPLNVCDSLNGSFIIYLLDRTRWNPLPAHYYCPECGYFEVVDTPLVGFDIPDKRCPSCNSLINADGYNIPLECVWNLCQKESLNFEYNIAASFLPFARKALEEAFPHNIIIPYGQFLKYNRSKDNDDIARWFLYEFIMLPVGQSLQDYSEYIAYLKNGERCFVCKNYELEYLPVKLIKLRPSRLLDLACRLQNHTGILLSDIPKKDLKNITWKDVADTFCISSTANHLLRVYEPDTFSRLCRFEALSCNTYIKDIKEHLILCYGGPEHWFEEKTASLVRWSTREDFYHALINENSSRNIAADITHIICDYMGLDRDKLLSDFHLPQHIKNIAYKCRNILPLSHVIEVMHLYFKLAYYLNHNSELYYKLCILSKIS